MASKFYVSPRLFAQILPLQLPALKSCGRRLAAVDRISLSEARSAPSATPRRLSVTHRCTADISWRGARLQWQDLGKKSRADVKFWSHHANSESKNLEKYSTRSFPLDQKINIPHVTDTKKRTLSNLLPSTQSLQPALLNEDGEKNKTRNERHLSKILCTFRNF